MVIDTSALVAMLTDEPDAPRLEAAVGADPVRLMSTASYLETAIVIETRFGEAGGRGLVSGCTGPPSTWSPWTSTKPTPRESPTAPSAKDATVRD